MLVSLIFTFTSGTGVFAHPISVANGINPQLQEFLQKKENTYKGIVFTDFIDRNLAKAIIQSNF